ncbi:hypothetical protein D3C72_940520 [compost metagenome]
MQQLATGEDVFLDEFAHARAQLFIVGAAGGDAMVHQQATGLDQALEGGKVLMHMGPAHMLEHADRGNLVKRLSRLELAVIHQQYLHAVLQALLGNQLLDIGMLVLGQRDARSPNAIVLCRPQQQAPPARAHIQKALARLQAQLAADQIELGLLGLRHIEIGLRVIRTRVDTARIEPQRIELVGDVVMKLDLLRILGQGVQGRRARARQQAAPPRRARRHRVRWHQCHCCRHDIAHAAVDLDIAFDDIGAYDPDIARRQRRERFGTAAMQTQLGVMGVGDPFARGKSNGDCHGKARQLRLQLGLQHVHGTPFW